MGNSSVLLEQNKLVAVETFQQPVKKKQVFIGLTGYYHKFILDYATTAAPFTEKEREGSGGPQHVTGLSRCWSKVVLKPSLEEPRPGEGVHILQIDVSHQGVGPILSQQDEHGEEHPVDYFSTKLPHEKYTTTVKKECQVIELAIHSFLVYLLAICHTDRSPRIGVAAMTEGGKPTTNTLELVPAAL